MNTIHYSLIMSGIVFAAVVGLWRFRHWLTCLLGGLVVVSSAAVTAMLMGEFFESARLLSYGWFVHMPVYLLASGLLTWRSSRRVACVCTLAAGAVVSVAVYSMWVEPCWLEVTHVKLQSSQINRPVRIAVVADLQTDVIDSHVRRSLARVLREQPDVILMAGDYLQARDRDHFSELCKQLNGYLKQIDFQAPLGVYAVAGNVDGYRWTRMFDGLSVQVFNRTESVVLDRVRITSLSLYDSFNSDTRITRPDDRFHVVFGHSPNFALGDIQADLLVAGHTHGGQVRLPLIGPLVVFSAVPRRWAAGVTHIGGGRHLIVSRGVGMERGVAPHVRFLCRPEIVVIDVVPKRSK